MKCKVEVSHRQEANDLRRALRDPQTRAFTLSMGALLRFKDAHAQTRVLRHVEETLRSWRRHRAGENQARED